MEKMNGAYKAQAAENQQGPFLKKEQLTDHLAASAGRTTNKTHDCALPSLSEGLPACWILAISFPNWTLITSQIELTLQTNDARDEVRHLESSPCALSW